jgi:hypothetical protein
MKKIIRLTEGELNNIIKDSVVSILREVRYVPHDGNGMVGGKYDSTTVKATTNILDKLLTAMADSGMDEELYEKFEMYADQNEQLFNVVGMISISYDESTGYGSANAPIYELLEVKGLDKIAEVIKQYPSQDQAVVQIALNALKTVYDNLSASDFDLDGEDEF